MKMNAWLRLGAVSFAASLFVAGCVVTSTTDNGDGGVGVGGSSGTGGSGTGGSATGGSGGTATGGSGGTATGGSGGTAQVTCNPNDPQNSTCDTCMQTTCCSEWEACMNDTECKAEFACVKTCVDNGITAINSDAGADAGDPSTLVQDCAAQCTPADAGSISDKTNTLIACARPTTSEAGQPCGVSCFGGY